MSTLALVNDQIRFRIRNIRKAKRLAMREVALRAGIPLSSYSAIENGYYKVNAENLYRILGALEADINEVWPSEGLSQLLDGRRLHLLREQDFRIQELVNIFAASGAALLVTEGGRCRPLLNCNLEDTFLQRLCFYRESQPDSTENPDFFFSVGRERTFSLFLADREPRISEALITYYLEMWAELFSEDDSLLEAAQNRQLQPR